MTPIEKFLSEVEARARAATAGPWAGGEASPHVVKGNVHSGGGMVIANTDGSVLNPSLAECLRNATFIAASRTDVVTLVECLQIFQNRRKLAQSLREESPQVAAFVEAIGVQIDARIGRRG